MRPVLLLLICLPLAAQTIDSAREAALGQAMSEQVRKSTTPVNSPEIRNYVAQLGARLNAQMPDPHRTFTLEIVSTDRSNILHEPLSLPGGYIFVPLDLLRDAVDEAEFAGMLAQAMARKSMVPLASPSAIPVMTVVGETFSGNEPRTGFAPERRRQIELDADKIAVGAMSKAGFDPAALLRYIERMQPSSYRVGALRETIQSLPAANYSEGAECARIRALLPPPATESSPPSLLH